MCIMNVFIFKTVQFAMRDTEAYCSRAVCLSVIMPRGGATKTYCSWSDCLSVTSISHRSLKTKCWNKQHKFATYSNTANTSNESYETTVQPVFFCGSYFVCKGFSMEIESAKIITILNKASKFISASNIVVSCFMFRVHSGLFPQLVAKISCRYGVLECSYECTQQQSGYHGRFSSHVSKFMRYPIFAR